MLNVMNKLYNFALNDLADFTYVSGGVQQAKI